MSSYSSPAAGWLERCVSAAAPMSSPPGRGLPTCGRRRLLGPQCRGCLRRPRRRRHAGRNGGGRRRRAAPAPAAVGALGALLLLRRSGPQAQQRGQQQAADGAHANLQQRHAADAQQQRGVGHGRQRGGHLCGGGGQPGRGGYIGRLRGAPWPQERRTARRAVRCRRQPRAVQGTTWQRTLLNSIAGMSSSKLICGTRCSSRMGRVGAGAGSCPPQQAVCCGWRPRRGTRPRSPCS